MVKKRLSEGFEILTPIISAAFVIVLGFSGLLPTLDRLRPKEDLVYYGEPASYAFFWKAVLAAIVFAAYYKAVNFRNKVATAVVDIDDHNDGPREFALHAVLTVTTGYLVHPQYDSRPALKLVKYMTGNKLKGRSSAEVKELFEAARLAILSQRADLLSVTPPPEWALGQETQAWLAYYEHQFTAMITLRAPDAPYQVMTPVPRARPDR